MDRASNRATEIDLPRDAQIGIADPTPHAKGCGPPQGTQPTGYGAPPADVLLSARSQVCPEPTGPGREGLRALEHAGLVAQRTTGDGGNPAKSATRLGETALAEGSVCQYLTASGGV